LNPMISLISDFLKDQVVLRSW